MIFSGKCFLRYVVSVLVLWSVISGWVAKKSANNKLEQQMKGCQSSNSHVAKKMNTINVCHKVSSLQVCQISRTCERHVRIRIKDAAQKLVSRIPADSEPQQSLNEYDVEIPS